LSAAGYYALRCL